MSLSVIDAIIILFIAMGGVVGFKSGAIKEGTKFIGLFVVIVISFILKDSLMVLFYENLPFFDFFGALRGLQAINILFYQLAAFLVIFGALFFLLRVLLVITGLVEVLLKMTVFLSFPSKIVGIVVGIIEYYVYVFIILYVLSIPILNFTQVNDSMLGNKILEGTPFLSGLVDDTVYVYADVWNIIKNKKNRDNKEINALVLATLLDHKLISIDSARKLVSANKIMLSDDSLLDNYQEDDFYELLKERLNYGD